MAVVGHVEWVEFAVVERLPPPGAIVHALEPPFSAPGGGGAVAAVQLARLAGSALFLTSVGDDAAGARAARELRDRHGVDVHAAVHPVAQRRGFTHLDGAHERTITVLGERHVPHRDDPLPWDRLAGCDGVYFTGGDEGALEAARAARVLVATPRALDVLVAAGVRLDVLVASATDPGERVVEGMLDPPPAHVVLTEGGRGGSWTGVDGTTGRWAAAAPPGEPVDAYGCGDTFAAALTAGLAAGLGMGPALELAARCGAACLTGRGPYGAPLPPAPW
jgi:ribokinase